MTDISTFDLSVPTLINITVKDKCLFCILNIEGDKKVNIIKCEFHLCDEHMNLIKNNCIY